MKKTILLNNIASLTIMQIANIVLPFITIPYISKIIGPEKFGILSYSTAIIAYFILLVNFSFDMQASRAVAQNPNDQSFINKIFSNILYTKILLLGLSTIGFLLLLMFLPQWREEKQVAIYTFIILIGWVFTPNWLYQGKQQLGKIAKFNLFAKILFTISIFVFIHTKEQYIWQPLLLSISQILVGTVSFILAFTHFKIILIKLEWHNILSQLEEGKELFFSMITINMYSSSTIIILGLFLTVTQVGYYSAAYRLIITVLSVLLIPLTQALYPFISGSFNVDKKKGIRDLQSIMPVCIVFSFFYSVCFFFLAPTIIHLLYGQEFNPAINVFRILSVVPFLVSINTFLGVHAMLNLKMDKEFFKITLISSFIGIGSAVGLGYLIGINGGAISWIIAECCNCLLFYLALKKISINLFNPEYYRFEYLKLLTFKGIHSITQKYQQIKMSKNS